MLKYRKESKIFFLIVSYLLGEEDDGVLKSHRSIQKVCCSEEQRGWGGGAQRPIFHVSETIFSVCRPMQRKLITLVTCQLLQEEGRARGVRAAR